MVCLGCTQHWSQCWWLRAEKAADAARSVLSRNCRCVWPMNSARRRTSPPTEPMTGACRDTDRMRTARRRLQPQDQPGLVAEPSVVGADESRATARRRAGTEPTHCPGLERANPPRRWPRAVPPVSTLPGASRIPLSDEACPSPGCRCRPWCAGAVVEVPGAPARRPVPVSRSVPCSAPWSGRSTTWSMCGSRAARCRPVSLDLLTLAVERRARRRVRRGLDAARRGAGPGRGGPARGRDRGGARGAQGP